MRNYHCGQCVYLPLSVSILSSDDFVMLLKILWSSLHCSQMDRYSLSSKYSVAYSSSIQYKLSEHSLYAIYILAIKSFLLIAQIASAMFAPMLVPLLTSCLLNRYSFFSFRRYLYKLTILIAKSLLFSATMLFSLSMMSLKRNEELGVKGDRVCSVSIPHS